MLDNETKEELKCIIEKLKTQHDGRDFDYITDDEGNLSKIDRQEFAWDQCCWKDHWYEQFTGEHAWHGYHQIPVTFADILTDEFQEFIDHHVSVILSDPHLAEEDEEDLREEVESEIWAYVDQLENQVA